MFSWLAKLVKKIIKFLLKFWFIILVLVIVFAPVLGPVLTAMAATLPGWITWAVPFIAALGKLGWIACLIIGLGVSFLVFPEETIEVIKSIAEGVGSLIGAVVSGVAKGLGISKYLMIGGAAWLGYTLFFSDSSQKDDDEKEEPLRDLPSSSVSERKKSIPISSNTYI